jgi:hypothetical protein
MGCIVPGLLKCPDPRVLQFTIMAFVAEAPTSKRGSFPQIVVSGPALADACHAIVSFSESIMAGHGGKEETEI